MARSHLIDTPAALRIQSVRVANIYKVASHHGSTAVPFAKESANGTPPVSGESGPLTPALGAGNGSPLSSQAVYQKLPSIVAARAISVAMKSVPFGRGCSGLN